MDLWPKLNPNIKPFHLNNNDKTYLYADCYRSKGNIVFALKIIQDQCNAELLDMEREILSAFPKRTDIVRVLLNCYTVQYQTKIRDRKPYDRTLKYTNYALFYQKAEYSLAGVLAEKEVSPAQLLNLAVSAMKGIEFVHRNSVVMRKITVANFDVIGQNRDTCIVANFEDACFLPPRGSRWAQRLKTIDQAVEYMSPELARFIVTQRRLDEQARAEGTLFFPDELPPEIVLSSDSFMLGQLIYFMARKQSLYPKQLIETAQDIHERYNDVTEVFQGEFAQMSPESKINYAVVALAKRFPHERLSLSAIIDHCTDYKYNNIPELQLTAHMRALSLESGNIRAEK